MNRTLMQAMREIAIEIYHNGCVTLRCHALRVEHEMTSSLFQSAVEAGFAMFDSRYCLQVSANG